jgi:hypothetical protein
LCAVIVPYLQISDKGCLLEEKAAHSSLKGKKYWWWHVFIFQPFAQTVSCWRCNKTNTLTMWDFRSSVTVVSKHGSRMGYTSHRRGQVVPGGMSLPEHHSVWDFDKAYTLILNIPFPLGLVVEISLQITTCVFIFAQKLHKYGGITFVASAERTCLCRHHHQVLLLLLEHRASMKSLQSPAVPLISFYDLPVVLISSSIVLWLTSSSISLRIPI